MNASSTELPAAPEVNSTLTGVQHEQIRRRGEETTMERAAATARKQPSVQKTAKEEKTVRRSLRDSLTKRGYLLLVLVAVSVLLAACGGPPGNQKPIISDLDIDVDLLLEADLSATVRDPDGQVARVVIDWGNDTDELSGIELGDGVVHADNEFQSEGAGTYTVTVTATDNEGASTTRREVLEINANEVVVTLEELHTYTKCDGPGNDVNELEVEVAFGDQDHSFDSSPLEIREWVPFGRTVIQTEKEERRNVMSNPGYFFSLRFQGRDNDVNEGGRDNDEFEEVIREHHAPYSEGSHVVHLTHPNCTISLTYSIAVLD